MTTDIPAAAPAPAEPKPNPFARMIGVLFSPSETFASIARRPDWVVPLLTILLIGYVGTFIVLPRMDWDAITAMQEEQMRKNPNVSQEQIDQMAKMTKAGGKVFGYVAPVVFVIWYLLVAGVLLLTFRLTGGQGTFKQAFSVTLYSWMPMLLGSIVGTIVILARGGLFDPTYAATLVKSNPAFLVDIKTNPVLFALLASFDIFTIWTVVLLIIGFAALSRSSKAKASIIVLSWWVVAILIKLIGPAMQSMRK
jgi:hypothetical protein